MEHRMCSTLVMVIYMVRIGEAGSWRLPGDMKWMEQFMRIWFPTILLPFFPLYLCLFFATLIHIEPWNNVIGPHLEQNRPPHTDGLIVNFRGLVEFLENVMSYRNPTGLLYCGLTV